MKLKMANITGLEFDCPYCHRSLKSATEALGVEAFVKCQYCGAEIEMPSQIKDESSRQNDTPAHKNDDSYYVAGTWRKKKKIRSACLALVKLAVLFLIIFFLGGGKFNGTYFFGVKRSPGFKNTLVSFEPVTAFGMPRMEQKVRKYYSYIIVGYNERTGPLFFKRM